MFGALKVKYLGAKFKIINDEAEAWETSETSVNRGSLSVVRVYRDSYQFSGNVLVFKPWHAKLGLKEYANCNSLIPEQCTDTDSSKPLLFSYTTSGEATLSFLLLPPIYVGVIS